MMTANVAINGAARSEVRDGMHIDWDVAIEMDDGLVLKADVYRPVAGGRYPVIMTYGPYAKGLSMQEGYPGPWEIMVAGHPDVPYGSTNKYQTWEAVDPEKWVPDGYACVRVDSRGCGRSPGYIDHFSPRETQDFYQCIEWAGVQSWSNGKVGLDGISYYAVNQWHVASLQPPHLAAICVWEGYADWYRDATHHGGILTTFHANWYDSQVKSVQYGLGVRGPRSAVTGELVCGDATLSDQQLAANRCDFGEDLLAHPLDDDYHRARSPIWDKVQVPLLSAGNWGGQGLHPRGNFEGFVQSASRQKWLEVHGLEHFTHFYTDYGVGLQKQFFAHFLKGEDNGWDKRRHVQLQVRHVDGFVERFEDEWPLARTSWTRFYLRPDHLLSGTPAATSAALGFEAMGDGLTFVSGPLAQETEITGPLAAKLFASSSTTDADLFLVFRVFTPDLREVVFQGANDPHTPIGQGWLRASHRKLDPKRSLPYRPYHSHDEIQPLQPGVPVELDVEIIPTSIVVPAGYRIGLSVRGRDYEWAKHTGIKLPHFKNELLGCGPVLHNDPRDRPPDIFGGRTTLHFDRDKAPYVLLPIGPNQACHARPPGAAAPGGRGRTCGQQLLSERNSKKAIRRACLRAREGVEQTANIAAWSGGLAHVDGDQRPFSRCPAGHGDPVAGHGGTRIPAYDHLHRRLARAAKGLPADAAERRRQRGRIRRLQQPRRHRRHRQRPGNRSELRSLGQFPLGRGQE
jgi:predicted acyl esterase